MAGNRDLPQRTDGSRPKAYQERGPRRVREPLTPSEGLADADKAALRAEILACGIKNPHDLVDHLAAVGWVTPA